MTIKTIKVCRANIALILSGLTPTGDIFAESSEPDEIKANTADLDLKKDTNSGMSDLKKPQ